MDDLETAPDELEVSEVEAFVTWLRRSGSSIHTTRAYSSWLAELALFH